MLWDDFLNSEWRDWRGSGRSEDRLERKDWVEELIRNHRLRVSALPTAQEMDKLRSFRSFLLSVVRSIATGKALLESQIKELNRWMEDGPLVRRLHAGMDGRMAIGYTPLESGWQGVIAEIAGSFAVTLAEGEASRIRICTNPDCLWVYYDDTRNRSKRYCDEKACGNLMKVRRFRAKKKQNDSNDNASLSDSNDNATRNDSKHKPSRSESNDNANLSDSKHKPPRSIRATRAD